MGVCFLGDLILGNYAPLSALIGANGFIKGAGTFMLGHVLYTVAFVLAVRQTGKPLFNKGFVLGAVVSVVTLGTLPYLAVVNPSGTSFMLWMGVVYGLFIGSACTVVFSYAHILGGVALLNAAGIVSFLISDYLIGLQAIGGIDFPGRSVWIWIFYPIGQFLLLLPAFSFKRRPNCQPAD